MSLHPDRYVDADHPHVVDFAQTHAGGKPLRDGAIALFYAVRDGWRYDPWHVSSNPDDFRASVVLARDPAYGHCIDKAVLLAAAARAVGIPARLRFANVRNHMGTAKLEEALGTDLLVYHGWAELRLADRWVGATPAFNRELCDRLGVAPLEFDGEHDAVFQEYDRAPGAFMEYVADHGAHDSPPFDDMFAAWRAHYPREYVGHRSR